MRIHFQKTLWIVLVFLIIIVVAVGCDLFGGDDSGSGDSTQPSPEPIILYDAGRAYTGNLGGRSGADNICRNSPNKPRDRSNIRAFISVDAYDEIRDLPANYAVPTDVQIIGPNGNLLANDWADLLDGQIENRLVNAGLFGGGGLPLMWWSGSNPDGSLLSFQCCSNWTTSAGMPEDGHVGDGIEQDSQWISNSFFWCDENVQATVLCIGY
jgi:hypothetical protein